MSNRDLPPKEIRKIVKRIAPDLERLLELLDESDENDLADGVIEDSIRSGAHSLLIAGKIIKERKK